MTLQRTFNLSSRFVIPALGFGTWRIPPNQAGNVVEKALRVGYQHIDGAAIYNNEQEIGKVFATMQIPRSSLFVTSKLWNTHHRPKDVEEAAEKTLSDLKLSYLDLYLIHWPVSFKKDAGTGGSVPRDPVTQRIITDDGVTFRDTWQALEKLVDQGKVRSLGLSNFTIKTVQDILDIARIKPAVLQVELHPYLQQNKLLEFCKQNEIVVTAYSPLGSGRDPKLIEDPIIVEVAKKHNKTPAQVLISWAIQRGTVVIPRTVTPSRIEENFLDFLLEDEDMAKINGLGTRKNRFLNPQQFWQIDVFAESSE